MKWLTLAAATACVLSSSAAYADVTVTINNGLVSVVAKDATIRQILTEWARVGQTKIVNVEKIPGAPISVELTNVPEGRALDILLRSVSGYMAAPRATLATNLSRFDRIVVMPTTAAPRAPVAAAPQAPAFGPGSQFGQPGFTPPQFAQPLADDDVDDDRAQPNVPVPGNGRPPVFNTFPQPQIINPATGQPIALPQGFPIQPNAQQPAAAPTGSPTSPFGGVAVPGMMVPSPQQQQPGQIGVPVQQPNPNQPRRPGGQESRDQSDRL